MTLSSQFNPAAKLFSSTNHNPHRPGGVLKFHLAVPVFSMTNGRAHLGYAFTTTKSAGSDDTPLATTKRSYSPAARSLGRSACVVTDAVPVATPIIVCAAITDQAGGFLSQAYQRVVRSCRDVVNGRNSLR